MATFYAQFVLTRKGPLAKIWLAAHWDKKLTKAHVFETDIVSSVDAILEPQMRIALRTCGHLLLGVVRIYSRKAKYLLSDCNETYVKLKMAFRPNMPLSAELPEESREAALAAITLPETFSPDFDLHFTPDILEFSMRPKGLAGGKNVMAHQSRPEEITMKETFSAGAGGGILRPSLLNRHEDFGDFGLDDREVIRHEEVRTSSSDGLLGGSGSSSGADRMRRSAFDADLGVGPNGPASVASVGTVDLGFGPENLDNFGDLPSVGSLSADRAPLLLDFDAPGSIHADQFGDEMFGGLLNDFMSGPEKGKDLLGGVEDAHSGLDDHRMIDPDDIGLRLFETGSRLGDNDLDTESVIAVDDVPPKRARTDDGSDAASDGPADSAAPGPFKKPEDVDLHAGEKAKKRRRKIAIDDPKVIPSDAMKQQLESTADILSPLDIAPPTRKLMHWKEVGSADRMFQLPSRFLNSKYLSRLFSRHLVLCKVSAAPAAETAQVTPDASMDRSIARAGSAAAQVAPNASGMDVDQPSLLGDPSTRLGTRLGSGAEPSSAFDSTLATGNSLTLAAAAHGLTTAGTSSSALGSETTNGGTSTMTRTDILELAVSAALEQDDDNPLLDRDEYLSTADADEQFGTLDPSHPMHMGAAPPDSGSAHDRAQPLPAGDAPLLGGDLYDETEQAIASALEGDAATFAGAKRHLPTSQPALGSPGELPFGQNAAADNFFESSELNNAANDQSRDQFRNLYEAQQPQPSAKQVGGFGGIDRIGGGGGMGLRAPTPSSITVGRTQLPSLSGGLVSPGGSISSSAGLASPSPLAGLSGLASQEPQLLSDEQRSLFNKRVLQLYRDIRQTTQLQQLQGLPAQLTFRDICKATNKKMAATKFFTLLFLAKTHAVRLAQPELFGDIEISPVARTGAPSEAPSLASSRVGSPLPDGNAFYAQPPSVPSSPMRPGSSRPPSAASGSARDALPPPASPPNAAYVGADYSLMQQRLSQDARIHVQQSL